MIYLSTAMYLVVALLFMQRFFRAPALSRFVISFFLTLTAGNILVVELLHFLKAVDNPLLYLALQLLLCAVAGLLLVDPAGKLFKGPLPRLSFGWSRKFTLESFLSLLIFAVLGLALYIGAARPHRQLRLPQYPPAAHLLLAAARLAGKLVQPGHHQADFLSHQPLHPGSLALPADRF